MHVIFNVSDYSECNLLYVVLVAKNNGEPKMNDAEH